MKEKSAFDSDEERRRYISELEWLVYSCDEIKMVLTALIERVKKIEVLP